MRIRPPDYARFRRVARVFIPGSPAEVRLFYARLRGEVGKPYSTRTILGFLAGRDFNDRSAWICHALQAWCLCEAGLLPRQLFAFLRRLTPNSLYLAALTASHCRRA